MATGTIYNTLTDPSGTALQGVTITAQLQPGFAFHADNPAVEITSQETTTTDSSGNWTLVLEQNANITPGDSYWQITEDIPASSGQTRVWSVNVGAGSNSLYASLTSVPPATQPPVVYVTQSSGDARWMPAGTLTLGSIQPVGTATATGTATTAASSNHVHALNPSVVGSGLALSGGALNAANLTNSNVATGTRFIYINSTTPTPLVNGDHWYDTTLKRDNTYNGSVSIVTTPQYVTTTATVTTTQVTYGVTTGPAVSLVTGTAAIVTVGAAEVSNSANNGRSWIGCAVSGATTIAASDAKAFQYQAYVATSHAGGSFTFTFTGLTAGTNTFTIQYRCDTGTSTFVWTWMTVQAVPT